MQQEFDRILRGLLPDRGTVLLAVSGGRDSVCMAELFLHSALSVRFEVAHCNFSLRGNESDCDEAFVKQWCMRNDIVFNNIRFDTKVYAVERAISIEMAARELRYSWFGKLCREKGFSYVAVAHNSNDNAETLMLNLLRGTGIKGITGMKMVSRLPMPEYQDISLVRPILGFSRDEIDNYLNSIGAGYRDDSTNEGTDYKRNKLRHLVFPVFEEINPSFLDTFSNEMRHFAQVESIADEYYYSCRNNIINSDSSGELRLNIDSLLLYDNWKYLLYRVLAESGFGDNIVNSLSGIISREGTVSGKVFYENNRRIVTTSNEIIILPNNDDGGLSDVYETSEHRVFRPLNEFSVIEEGKGCMVVEGPGIYEFKGYRFRIEELEWNSGTSPVQPSGTLVWDADKMSLPILLRGWRKGDWLRPIGLGGKKKLSDLFVDLKYSLVDKERAIVMVPGDKPDSNFSDGGRHIAALLFNRIDDSVKITEFTKKVWRIRLL